MNDCTENNKTGCENYVDEEQSWVSNFKLILRTFSSN